MLALNIGADAIFCHPEAGQARLRDRRVKKAGAGGKEAGAKKVVPLAVRLPHAIVDKGKSIAKQCQACHTLDKGGPNRVGPNLWDIVGDERGEGRGGFNFSAAMKKKGGKWTYEELNKFLTNPREYIPGTAMTFAGLPSDAAARRRDRLSAHAVGQSGAAAQAAGRAGEAGGSAHRRRRKAPEKPAEAPKAPAAQPPAAPAK